jgi:hypothetical protein
MPICVQNASCMCEPTMLRTHLDQECISFPTPWNQVWEKQNSQVLPFFLFECLQSFQIKSQEEIIQMYHDTIDNQDCEGITQATHHFETRKKVKMYTKSKKSFTQSIKTLYNKM